MEISGSQLRERAAALVRYLRAQASGRPAARLPAIIWREASAQHFASRSGRYEDWDHAVSECLPLEDGATASAADEAQAGELGPASERSHLSLLRTWRRDRAMHFAHIGSGGGGAKVDCTHWCLPGVPNLWNRELLSLLRSLQTLARLPAAAVRLARPKGVEDIAADWAEVQRSLLDRYRLRVPVRYRQRCVD